MEERFNFLQQGASVKLPVEVTFEHDLAGAQSEVALQYWPRRDGSDSAPTQLTLFILGNPGLLNYYIPFLTFLHNRLPPSHALLSTSHIGHTPDLKCPQTPLDLHQQLEAKVELVRGLRRSLDVWSEQHPVNDRDTDTHPKLCLMGHSVGSWFLCELMKNLPEEVHAGYMLFPTVGWIADTWNGRTLWPIFRQPVKGLLPILSPFLRPVLPLTTFPPTTLSLLRSSETIRHVLSLSRSEMDDIREPDLDWFKSQAINDKTKGLFGAWSAGNLDGWVGREGPMVQNCLGGMEGGRIQILEGVPHAFCLNDEHSEVVAEVVAGWINAKPVDPRPPRDETSAVDSAVPM